jgi:hypothetical protein
MLTREALGGSLFMHLSRCKRHLERLAVSLQGNGLIATLDSNEINGVIGPRTECRGLGRLLEGGWRGSFLGLWIYEPWESAVCQR